MLIRIAPRSLLLALGVCLIAYGVTGCSVVEKTTETHTVHLIDSGSAVNNGLKVISDDEIQVAVFIDGAKPFVAKRRLNGMYIVTPDRYLELRDYEVALLRFLAKHSSESALDVMIRQEIDAELSGARPDKNK